MIIGQETVFVFIQVSDMFELAVVLVIDAFVPRKFRRHFSCYRFSTRITQHGRKGGTPQKFWQWCAARFCNTDPVSDQNM